MNKKIVGIFVCTLLIAMALPVAGTINIGQNKLTTEATLVNERISTISMDVDWWPMFHHDPEHTGYTTSSAPTTDTVLWSFYTDDGITTSPAVVENKVYTATWYGTIFCLDSITGNVMWEYDTENTELTELFYIENGPAVYDGKVYIGSIYEQEGLPLDKGVFYCLDADNGDELWTHDYENGAIRCAPTVVDNKVYLTNGDTHCLDAMTGDEIWVFGQGSSTPAVADGKVYVTQRGGDVFCLDAETGEEIWTYDTSANGASCPTVYDGKVYFCIYWDDPDLVCLDADTGDKLWQSDKGGVYESPTAYDGKIYIGVDKNFYCLDADDGTELWNVGKNRGRFSNAVIADGKAYLGSGFNFRTFFCFDAENGNELWNMKMPTKSLEGSHFPAPAIADGRLYVPYGNVGFGIKHGWVFCFGDIDANAPDAPTIDGPTSGKPGIEYTYTFATADPNGDDVYYYINWDDGTVDEWIGPYASDETVEGTHEWQEKGSYNIKAAARDTNDLIGELGTLSVTMPVNQPQSSQSNPSSHNQIVNNPPNSQSGSQQSSNPLFFQILQRLLNIR